MSPQITQISQMEEAVRKPGMRQKDIQAAHSTFS